MIKRAPSEVHRENSSGAKQRRRSRPLSLAAPFAVILAAAVGAFYAGANLHKWLPRHHFVQIIDAAVVTIVPSSTASTVLITTPDHHTVVLTSDFGPTTTALVTKCLLKQHHPSVDAIILTSVTSNSADGIVSFAQQIPFSGIIVSPYAEKEPAEWWNRSEHNFAERLKNHDFEVVSWMDSQTALQSVAPQVQIDLISAPRSKWESPDLLARVAYRRSSLLDLSSLTSQQIAAMTGRPLEASRLLLVNGADQFVTKELLNEVQPEVVVLTGTAELPPGDRAESNVQAADARAIAIATSAPVNLVLPASDSLPLTD